jgi:exosortase/archaeosortase
MLMVSYVRSVVHQKVSAISLHLFYLIVFLKFTPLNEIFRMQVSYSVEWILEMLHQEESCWRDMAQYMYN